MPIPTDTIDKLEQTWRVDQRARRRARPSSSGRRRPTCPAGPCRTTSSHLIGTERMLQGLPAADAPADDRRAREEPDRRVQRARGRRTPRRCPAPRCWPSGTSWSTLRVGDAARRRRRRTSTPAMATPTGPGTVADFLHIRVLDCWIARAGHAPRRSTSPGTSTAASRSAHHRSADCARMPIVVGKRAGHTRGRRRRHRHHRPVERHVVCEVTMVGPAVVDAASKPSRWPRSRSTPRRSSCSPPVAARPPTHRRAASLIEGDQRRSANVSVDNLNMMI